MVFYFMIGILRPARELNYMSIFLFVLAGQASRSKSEGYITMRKEFGDIKLNL